MGELCQRPYFPVDLWLCSYFQFCFSQPMSLHPVLSVSDLEKSTFSYCTMTSFHSNSMFVCSVCKFCKVNLTILTFKISCRLMSIRDSAKSAILLMELFKNWRRKKCTVPTTIQGTVARDGTTVLTTTCPVRWPRIELFMILPYSSSDRAIFYSRI